MTNFPFGQEEESFKFFKEEKPVYCSACGCTGFILMRVKRFGMEYAVAARCACKNGQRKSKYILDYESLKNRLGFQEYEILDIPKQERLPEVRYEELIQEARIKFKGVVVNKCVTCGKDYRVIHAQEVPVAWIIEAYEHCKGVGTILCDLCFYKRGKDRGVWS